MTVSSAYIGFIANFFDLYRCCLVNGFMLFSD